MHIHDTNLGILTPREQADQRFLLNLIEKEGLGGIIAEVDGYKEFRNEEAFTELESFVKDLANDTETESNVKKDIIHAKVREMLHSLSPDWNSRKLAADFEQWFKFFNETNKVSEEAPVTYLGLTIAQAIRRTKRVFAESQEQGGTSTPTKIIILTGFEFTATNYSNLVTELTEVKAYATEFSVTTIYFGDNDVTSKKLKV